MDRKERGKGHANDGKRRLYECGWTSSISLPIYLSVYLPTISQMMEIIMLSWDREFGTGRDETTHEAHR